MKIAILDLMFHWPPSGGSWVDMMNIATHLSEMGHDVKLFYPKWSSGIFPRGLIEKEVPVAHEAIEFTAKSLNCFTAPKRVKQYIDRFNPDYVFITDGYFLKPYFIKALAKDYKVVLKFFAYELICPRYSLLFRNEKFCPKSYFKTPFFCTYCASREMLPFVLRRHFFVYNHEYIVSLAFLPTYLGKLKRAIRSCHAIIVYNELTKGLLEKYSDNINIMSGGVDVKKFVPPEQPKAREKKLILMSGRSDDPRKGFQVLQKAARMMAEKRNDFEILVTWGGDNPVEDDFVKPLKWRPQEEMAQLYQDIDIGVVPSVWQEPFGLVALEAMAAGKPVVVTQVGGLQSLVNNGENGFVIPPNNAEELAEKLTLLLDSEDLRHKMGKAGRKIVEERFDWNIVAKRYVDEIFI
jgi:glycosyltransferase involved in cell wall biosynthesis